LPVGIYKSLELLFNEFIRSDYYNNIYQEFLNEFSGNQVTNTANENILNKRQEIEKRFSGLIKYTGSNLGFEDIKNIIYNENGREDLQKIINSFSSVEDFNQLQELVLLTMEAWNYFPHKRLNNLSPMEKV
jgi:hypothetical protein